MRIFIDTREKARAIVKIIDTFEKSGVQYASTKLYVGDYQNVENPKIVVDRKQNLNELANNVCQDHKRFVAELQRANDMGIKIVFLCEHGPSVKTMDDVKQWKNPRLRVSPLAMSGERLHKILSTISTKYGCEFLFCTKTQTGKRIMEILSDGGRP